MGLSYPNLDDRTRQFMIQELERDIANGTVYISDRLNERGLGDGVTRGDRTL